MAIPTNVNPEILWLGYTQQKLINRYIKLHVKEYSKQHYTQEPYTGNKSNVLTIVERTSMSLNSTETLYAHRQFPKEMRLVKKH